MTKKKKSTLKSLLGLGLTAGVGVTALGALPTNPIIGPVTSGFGDFAGAIRPGFGLAGAGVVIGGASKVVSVTKDLAEIKKFKKSTVKKLYPDI